jgi:taurine--2-oxoglutarate transaminase
MTMATPNKMSAEEMVSLCKKYTLWSWSAQDAVNPIPWERAEGIYFWDVNGKRYIDMSSQLVCSNIGYGNRRVIDAIKQQAEELAYAGPGMATRVRAEIGPLLAKHTPGDLNKFFFTLGGAEANENAIKLARQFSGRQKIITRYRSYHGSTSGAITLTGDPRRWANEPGITGIIRAFDPYGYRCSFGKDNCSDCSSMLCLSHIEEIMMYEGPHTVAAVFIESVTGTNGLIVPPDGYMQGLRTLCDKHGVLLICDEVMAGLGRTGEWFAVDHWKVIPDIITMAKGLTSAYMPLGCVAMSDRIAAHFGKNVFYGGLTYNAHPMSLAAAVANLKVLEDEDIIGNSKRMGSIMAQLLKDLKDKHPSVGDARSIGLFGMLELVKNRKTREPMAPYNSGSPVMAKFGAFLLENGLSTFTHWHKVFTTPPLTVTEAELREAFGIIDRALEITDQEVAG